MRAAPARGGRGAHVGRAALAVDVRRRPLRRRPPVPRRLAHPRAARPRARGDRRPRRRRRRPTPGRSSSARRPPPGCPAAATRPRDDGAAAAATPGAALRPRAAPHPCPTAIATCLRTLFPRRARRLPRRRDHPTPSTGWRPSPSSASPGRTRSSREQGPDALAEALHAVGHRGRGGPGRRGRHPAGHRPRHRRRQVLPRLGRAQPPTRTTRAGCCARCGGSPTPTSRCRCSSASTAATCSPPRSAIAERAAYSGHGRHDEHRGPDHGARRRPARSTPTPRCSSTPGPCSPSTPAGPFAMKGKAVPLVVYEVGEELGTRDEATADSRLPFLGRDEEIATVRRALERGAGRRRRGRHRRRRHRHGQVAPGRTRPSSGDHRAATLRRGPRRAVRGGQRLPRAARPAPHAARRRARRPGGHGPGPARGPRAGRPPTCCRWLRCSPTSPRSTCRARPRPTGSTRSTALTGSPTPSSTSSSASLPGPLVLVAEEAHWADGASAALLDRLAFATRRPAVGGRSSCGAATTGGFAPATGRRWCWARCRRRSSSAWSSQPPRRPPCGRTRSPPSSTAPRATRSSSRRSPGSPWAPGRSSSCPSRCSAAMSTQIDQLAPRGAPRSCATARCSAAASGARCCERTLAADGLTLDAATLDGLSRVPRARRRGRGSGSATASFATRPTRGWPSGSAPASTGWPARCSRTISTDLDADSPTLGAALRAGRRRASGPGGTRRWPASWPARSYANADAADHFETRARGEPPGAGRHRRRPGAALGGRRASCASSPGMFEESVEAYRTRPQAAPGTTPWPRPRSSSRQAAVHTRTGALHHRAARGRPGAAAARRPTRATAAARRTRVRPRQPHGPRPRRSRSARGTPGCGPSGRLEAARELGEPETLVSALMLLDYRRPAAGRARARGTTPRGARHLRRARACASRSRRVRANLGALAYYAGAGARRPSGTGRAARWPWRRATPSARPRPTSTSPSCSSTRAGSTRRRRCSSRRARVLRASGAVSFLAQGEMQLARAAPQPGRPRRGRARAAAVAASTFAALRQRHERPGGRPGAGRGGDPRRPARGGPGHHRRRGARGPRTRRPSPAPHLPPTRPGAAGARPARGGRRDGHQPACSPPARRTCPTRSRCCCGSRSRIDSGSGATRRSGAARARGRGAPRPAGGDAGSPQPRPTSDYQPSLASP